LVIDLHAANIHKKQLFQIQELSRGCQPKDAVPWAEASACARDGSKPKSSCGVTPEPLPSRLPTPLQWDGGEKQKGKS